MSAEKSLKKPAKEAASTEVKKNTDVKKETIELPLDKYEKEIIEFYPNSKSKIEVVHVPLSEGYNFKNINDNKTFKILQIATSSHNKNVTRSIKSLKDLKIEYVGCKDHKNIAGIKV